MDQTHVPFEDHHKPGLYEIRIKGHLDIRWATWFEGMRITHESDGSSTLSGPVIDQAALHGLLKKVRDMGLALVSVIQIDPGRPRKETDA